MPWHEQRSNDAPNKHNSRKKKPLSSIRSPKPRLIKAKQQVEEEGRQTYSKILLLVPQHIHRLLDAVPLQRDLIQPPQDLQLGGAHPPDLLARLVELLLQVLVLELLQQLVHPVDAAGFLVEELRRGAHGLVIFSLEGEGM